MRSVSACPSKTCFRTLRGKGTSTTDTYSPIAGVYLKDAKPPYNLKSKNFFSNVVEIFVGKQGLEPHSLSLTSTSFDTCNHMTRATSTPAPI